MILHNRIVRALVFQIILHVQRCPYVIDRVNNTRNPDYDTDDTKCRMSPLFFPKKNTDQNQRDQCDHCSKCTGADIAPQQIMAGSGDRSLQLVNKLLHAQVRPRFPHPAFRSEQQYAKRSDQHGKHGQQNVPCFFLFFLSVLFHR